MEKCQKTADLYVPIVVMRQEEKGNKLDKFDEIKKYKELLDSGIISQEEFNAEKERLLGK